MHAVSCATMTVTTPRTESDDLRAAFLVGAKGITPLLLGIIPFGLVAGVAAIEADLGLTGAVAFSTVVFAGASQIVAINLTAQDAPMVVVVLTALVINVRMAMYSATLAPHFGRIPRGRRTAGAYVLTDQAFAVSILDYELHPHRSAREKFALYLGAGITLWSTWQIATVAGALGGGSIPESIPLGFAVPLAFLSLLVPAVTDRPTLVAAIVGGTVATIGAGWPSSLGMPIGALTGVVVGWLTARLDMDSALAGMPGTVGDGDGPDPADDDAIIGTDGAGSDHHSDGAGALP